MYAYINIYTCTYTPYLYYLSVVGKARSGGPEQHPVGVWARGNVRTLAIDHGPYTRDGLKGKDLASHFFSIIQTPPMSL